MQYVLQRRWYSNPALHNPWTSSLALAIATGIAYFLGAHLGLALLTQPDGVAVFWPASGIAAGTLVALGPTARLPVIVGIVAGSVVANLMGDRNLAATVAFTLCNVGEPILVAGLVNHYFGPRFRLDQVRKVLFFFAAAAVGAAAAGVGGATGFILFHNSGTPFLITWWNWFASAALGVVSVAPVVIGLAGVRHERPTKSELAEGLVLLAVLALVSTICLAAAGDHWFTILPIALLAPLALYLAARCRPLFAAATAFILAFVIVWTLTFGIGRLGDPGIPLVTRILAAQTALLALCGCILVFSALFTERRHHVFALERSNRRLQLALDCAELGTWSLDLKNSDFDNDVRDRHIHGHGPNAPPQTLAQMRAQVHPDDLSHLDGAFGGLKGAGGHCRAEYRLKAPSDQERAVAERWVAIEGTVVCDATGRAVQLLGVTHDITERKHAETRLEESERALRDLLGALPAAVYVTDATGRITYCNDAAANLWGARPRLGEDRWSDFARYYHADGTPMALQDCPIEIALHQGRAVKGREAILERVDGSRAWIAPYPTPLRDRTGAVVGAVNMVVDITERKQAEQTLAERNAQLALAGQFALIGTFTFDVGLERMQVSSGYVSMHGLSPGTEEISRDYWRAGVYPKDLPGVEAGFKQAIAARQREHYCEYRIVRAGGEVRWIDSRSLISYDSEGAARVVGANIDVTLRKQTEAALEAHKASLADALAAGRVMAFDWNAVTGRSCRSDNAALMLGIEDNQASSSTHNAFLRQVHPDDRGSVKAKIRELSPGSPTYALTFRFYAPNGEQVWLEETGKGEFDTTGRLLCVKGLTRDITDRKQAELVLEERNVLLALAGKAARVGSYAYDFGSDVMQVSEGYAALYGLPEGQTVVSRNTWLAYVHPEDVDRIEEVRRLAIRQGLSEYAFEFRALHPTAGVRWIEARSAISYRDEGTAERIVGVNIDITQRKWADAALSERNAQLDLASKIAGVGGFTVDLSTNVIRLSPGCAALYGLPEATTSMARDEVRRLIHPDDLARADELRDHAWRQRERELVKQFRVVIPNGGAIKWVEARILTSYSDDGRPVRMVGVAIDITAHKQAEHDRQRLAAIVDSSSDAIVSKDLNGAITTWNPGAERLFGYAPQEIIGKSITKLIPTDLHFEEASILERLARGERIQHVETTRVRKDGTLVSISLSASPLRDLQGKVIGASKIARDITDRKKAELMLEERNVLLALAGKAARVGSFAYDFGSDVMQVSEGYAALYGLPEGQTVVLRNAWLTRLHPEDIALVEELRRRAISQGLSEYGFECRILHPTSEVRWVEARIFISYKTDGCPLRVLGVNIDVTERKRSEDHQRALVAELDHRVKNVLATVVAIIAQTQEGHRSLPAYTAGLELRIKALSRTHELLSQNRWGGVSLGDIVRREFAPYEVGNAEMSGPNVTLTAEAAQAMAMVVHELTTNAAKYGALSRRNGRVQLRWWWLRNGSSGRLAIEWQEIGGPPVQAPIQTGYGTTIVRELVPYELNGTVALDFPADGVRCRMEIPPECISKDRAMVPSRAPVAAN